MKSCRRLLQMMTTAALLVSLLSGCTSYTKSYDKGTSVNVSKKSTENKKEDRTEPRKEYYFRTSDKKFEVYDGSGFEKMYIKGVNIGLGKPGSFPGECAISKEEYMRWFEKIADMGANTIRVYTVMMPGFYEALYEYNSKSDKKLYFFQGLWYDETKIAETMDAYALLDEAVSDAHALVDIIHGNAVIGERAGEAYGEYKYDVSRYAIGWILGIESEAEFVSNTNKVNKHKSKYAGKYLHTAKGASPYEAFMCNLGDKTLSYEMERYDMQRPVSWSNWPTADTLTHKNEPYQESEDSITINVENIKASDEFKAGIFASYHIYPYYPDFMMYEKKYASYKDNKGRKNTYKAYLKDLIKEHSVPVLVAEYGVPSSRGCTHKNIITGFNQGQITEKQQGEMLVSMSQDIYDTGYCGELIFAWQDEWFKRTWNTMEYSNEERRAYWGDVQTSEQNFGLLEFNSCPAGKSAVLDGDISEWTDKDVVSSSKALSISAKTDVKYLYLMVKGKKLNPEKDRIIIPVDITPKSGSYSYKNYKFNKAADFVIDMQGRKNTKVNVQNYYSRYTFSYKKYDDSIENKGAHKKDTDVFVPVYLSIGRGMTLPVDKKYIPYKKYDTGKLTYGISDTKSKKYNSLADFYYADNAVEIRIPWGMLNFRDPSHKEIEDDFNENGRLSGMKIKNIYIGAYAKNSAADMNSYTWAKWDKTEYTERLKQSYYIVKKHYMKLK